MREVENSLTWYNWTRYQMISSPNDFYRIVASPFIFGIGARMTGFSPQISILASVGGSLIVSLRSLLNEFKKTQTFSSNKSHCIYPKE